MSSMKTGVVLLAAMVIVQMVSAEWRSEELERHFHLLI
jgi:hypothetical protein